MPPLDVGRYDVLAREEPKYVRRFADVGCQVGRMVQSYVNGEGGPFRAKMGKGVV